MKSGFQNAVGRSFLVVVVLMTLLAGNVQSVFAAPPSNDDFDDATLIGTVPYSDTVDDVVTTATPKSGDPANDDPSLGACNNDLAGLATVWYKIVAPASGILTVDTSGSGYNTVAAVWSGSRGSLTMVSCDNDYYDIVPNGTSYTNAYVLSGTTYYIEITQIGGVSGASALSAASDEVGSLAVADQLVVNIGFDAVPVVGVGSYDDADSNWSYSATGWTHASSVTGAYASTHSFNSTSGADTEFNFVGDQFTLFYTTASNGGQMNVYIDNNPIYPPINEFAPTTQYQQTWTSQVLSPGAHRVRLEISSGTIYVDAIKVTYKVAPLGNIGEDYNPTYQWNHVPGITWYYFWLNGPSGKLLDQWFQASSICNAGLCAITPTTTLGGGNHTWWVQTYNSVGYGPWSTPKYFSTSIPTIPGTATLNLPEGDISTNYNPTYTWSEVPGATWYYLWINGPSGKLLNQWYQASTSCAVGTCSATPNLTLGGGNHAWWVQTYNSAGYGQWSSPKNFSTTIPALPGAATLNLPDGDISMDYRPAYTWNDVPGATWYYFWLNGPSGKLLDQWFRASSICNAGTCSITPSLTLNGGNHIWWIQTYNSAGYGLWSSPKNFSTTIPTMPGPATLNYPDVDIGTNYEPTYTWTEVPAATWYYLWIYGPSGKLLDQWYEAYASCTAGTCSATPNLTLGGGSHYWYIQTYNSSGYGQWSSPNYFNTTPLTIPGVATLNNPDGDIGFNYTPTYQWDVVTGATWYYLWINGPSGSLFNQWYQASAICGVGTCSATPNITLGGGSHAWWIQAYNGAGSGQWSSPKNFATTIPTSPGGVP